MDKTPAITVIVPVYNVSQYLDRWFAAIESQTFRDFSCLFVFDVSPDDTLQKLNDNIASHPAITSKILMKPKKEGLGKARDYALDSGLIHSKYLIFIDPDDQPLPHFLEKLYQKAEETQADVTFCGFRRINEDTGKVISTEMIHNPEVLTDLSKTSLICYLNPATWNKLIRSDLIGNLRFVVSGGAAEDEYFYLKLIPLCRKLAFVNEPLYDYGVRSNSLISTITEKSFQPCIDAYLWVKQTYQENPTIYAPFLPFLEASVFMRFGIGMTTRICLSNPKIRRKTIKATKHFLDTSFPGWKHNRYLSFRESVRHGLKTVMIWRCRYLYRLHCFGLFIWNYRVFTRLFKKDIKW